MKRCIAIGIQSFPKLRENNYFYIDKTHFIKEWWERGDEITLITRPRRFGKTSLLDTVKSFFSLEYTDRVDLFEGLSIWSEEKYKELQETYPVIYASFANVKERNFSAAQYKIYSELTSIYSDYEYILSYGILKETEIQQFKSVSTDMSFDVAT